MENNTTPHHPHLRRNPYDQSLGGVCSGIAAFYHLDPVLVRVLFVVLTLLYGGGVMLYLLLWLVIPEAKGEETKVFIRMREMKLRRLYRDTDNRLVGGVAAGLAHYYGIDRSLVRLGFAASFFLLGSGFWIYILLWIFLPAALSEDEKRRMTGAETTDQNTIHAQHLMSHSRSLFGKIIRGALIMAGSFIALVLVFVILALCVALVATSVNLGESKFFNDLLEFTVNDHRTLFLAKSGILLVLITPLAALLMGFIQILFKVHILNKNALAGLFLFFLAGAATLMYAGTGFVNQISDEQEKTETIQLTNADTLYLAGGEIPYTESEESDEGKTEMAFRDKGVVLSGNNFFVEVDNFTITPSERGELELIITRVARGKDREDAVKNIEMISFRPEIDGNRILIPSWFSLSLKDKFRWQEVSVKLRVPEGTILNMDMNFKEVLADQNLDEADGTWYKLHDNKLKCLDCDLPDDASEPAEEEAAGSDTLAL